VASGVSGRTHGKFLATFRTGHSTTGAGTVSIEPEVLNRTIGGGVSGVGVASGLLD
jgi:hypothetical protein